MRKTELQKYSDTQPKELGFCQIFLKAYIARTIQTTSQMRIHHSLKLCGIWVFRCMTFVLRSIADL